MKKVQLYIFLSFLFLSMNSIANTLTVDSGNTIGDINTGDRFMRIMEMNGDINIKVDSSETADMAISKLNTLITEKKFSLSNISRNAEISFRKDLDAMFIHENNSAKLTKMNCYTGETTYVGQVVSSKQIVSPNPVGNSDY